MNRDQYLQKKNWLRAKLEFDDVMLARDTWSAEDRHPSGSRARLKIVQQPQGHQAIEQLVDDALQVEGFDG